LLTLATRPRVGPKTLANPQPTRVGKRGVHGGKAPMAGGCGGCPPHKFKRGGELPTLANPPRVGPKTLANPQPTGVGKGGGGGAAPSQGVWGMCPQEFKRGGELPTLATRPRVGPKTLANPQPTRVGKRGVHGGKAPMAGGCGGCPPHKFKRGGELPTLANPPTSGTQNAGEPSANGGGQRGWRGRSPLPGGMGDVPPRI
jgi:hypothetical protein